MPGTSPPVLAPPTDAATVAVTHKLLAALYAEDVGGLRSAARWDDRWLVLPLPAGALRLDAAVEPGARLVVRGPVVLGDADGERVVADPVELLDLLSPPGGPLSPASRLLSPAGGLLSPAEGLLSPVGGQKGLRAELAQAVENLGTAYRRPLPGSLRDGRPGATGRAAADATDAVEVAAGLPVDDGARLLERLAVEGHPLHPCARTRLGMSPSDVDSYDIEADRVPIGFVGVRRHALVGDDVGAALLGRDHPAVRAADRHGLALQPVHPWQHEEVLRDRHRAGYRAGILAEVHAPTLDGVPTAALRTLLTADGAGRPCYVKLSLDVQVTSTRRSVSLATARNGAAVSTVVETLGGRGLLLREYAGAGVALPAGDRDVTAVLREPLAAVLRGGELAVPGGALGGRCPITGRTVLELLLGSGSPDAFLAAYVRALLRPVLRLAAGGVGLEAHGQNAIAVLRRTDGGWIADRFVFRDLGGIRLHRPRLRERGLLPRLHHGSVTVTDDLDVLWSKVGYTTVLNHLATVVSELPLPPRAGWAVARAAITEVADRDATDATRLLAPTLPRKALVTMRLRPDGGDRYVPVDNPLCP